MRIYEAQFSSGYELTDSECVQLKLIRERVKAAEVDVFSTRNELRGALISVNSLTNEVRHSPTLSPARLLYALRCLCRTYPLVIP